MKKLLTTLLAAFTAAAGIQAQVAFGHAEKINKGWRFLRVDSAWNISERPEMRERDFDDRQWRRVDLPHDWGVELPMSPDKGSCQGYLSGGAAWRASSRRQRASGFRRLRVSRAAISVQRYEKISERRSFWLEKSDLK